MTRTRNAFLLVIFLIFCTNKGIAQRITIFGKAPVRVEGEGFIIPEIKERNFQDDIGNCAAEKVVPVYLAGSWISIRTTDSPFGSSHSISENNKKGDTLYLKHYRSHLLYSRGFYTKTPIAGQTQIIHADSLKKVGRKRLLTDSDEIAFSFLKVNDFFFVDFLDYQTDTIVRRYYVKRVKIAPMIAGFRQDTGAGSGLEQLTKLAVNQSEIFLQPAINVRFMLANAFLPDSLLRYDLINLKTGDTLRYAGKKGTEVHKPEADTPYSLQLYYAMQPETVATYYLRVKPYWYRSPVFYFLAGTLILLLLLASTTVLIRRKLRSSERTRAEAEQYLRAVQSQLNPHFAFNAMSSIQGLINTNRITEANHYLQEFSMLLRKTLERSQHVFNTLDREIDMMRTYIGLEELRFNFSWDISVAARLNTSEIEIPTLLVQPLIENAIKHGVSCLGPEGRVLVGCREGNVPGSMMISVKDNGKGFDPANFGYGLKLTRERIAAVNRLHKEKSIELLFSNSSGMEVTLVFYNWTEQ